jgi:hypothetical protein
MGRPADRDPSYMQSAHGTTKLITDYGVMEKAREGISKYREALEQLRDPSSIRNADDYDDWEYGTEPIPHDHTWTRRRSS